ncbi:phage tail baseplate protein [Pseudoxanthomonas sacheonensis]|uniref:GTA baseplate fiber-binding domain-containing protein n=1 Tax=Pseudoxanthomonas sacheonensis TaxID=443615 RepID=UPI0013D7D9C4|nr:phage tail protein [Pseudoxanthomonas sacheonensis]KAF1706297.1 hypothetical protein CSC73_16465 [Pseudoxanthomonas sacheonensis]
MSGAQIGAAVGFVVGAFFGAPQLGAMIGGMIGGWISPTQVNGPHIGDGAAQTSQEGQPIPWIIGTAGWVQGNIVQISPRREVKKTDDGKGSGTEVNTFEAHQDYCILICESSEHRNSLMTGVLIVKVDGKIVYDMRPDKNFSAENAKFLRNHTFYDGNESQLPDPTMEAITGVGNTPAYRGVYTMVARDINLSQYGERIPVYEFVMVGAGEEVTTEVTSLAGPVYGNFKNDDWPLASLPSFYSYRAFWQGPDGAIQSDYFTSISECNEWFEDETGMQAPSLYMGYAATTQENAGNIGGNNTSGNPVKSNRVAEQPDITDFARVVLLYQFEQPQTLNDVAPTDDMCPLSEDWSMAWNGTVLKKMSFDDAAAQNLLIFANCDFPNCVAGYYPYCISVSRSAKPPDDPPIGDPCLLGVPVQLPDVPGYMIDCDGVVSPIASYTPVSGDYLALREESTSGAGDFLLLVHKTLGPIIDLTDADNTEAFWESAYDAAVTAGTMPAGLVYPTDYPTTIFNAFEQTYSTTTLTNNTVTVATAITRISLRGGLSEDDIDVVDMDQELLGYPILQSYNAADCLRPLMTGFTSYGSEYDAKLRFHKMGEDIEIVVDSQDFIDGSEADKDTREQQVEFPRSLSVTTIDPTQDYIARPQTDQSNSPDSASLGQESMQVGVVMMPDTARQLAAKGRKIAGARAQGFREFSLPYATNQAVYLKLVAGSPFALDGKRYIAAEYGLLDGELRIKALYDRQSAYTSAVTATPAPAPTSPPTSLGGVTLFAAMNLPRLRSKDNSPGMYIAVDGLLDSWAGCLLQMSIDDEATWTTAIASMTQSSVMGYLTAPIGVLFTDILSVAVHGGQLSSITSDKFADGGNPCAVVTSGVAEMLQFQTSDETEVDKYNLTDLGRARLGTTAAAHLQGDRFVQLENVYFLPLDINLAGRSIKFRPVTFGTSPDNNAVYEVTFSPLFTGPQIVEAYVNESGDQYVNESGSTYYRIIN